VAAYTVALRIAEQAFSLVKQFVNALPPFIVRADGRGDREGLARMLVLGVRASLVPAALVALPLAAFPGELIGAWVGPQLGMAGAALAVLAVAMALMAPQLVISSLLTYTGRHATTSRIALVSAIVNVLASVALVGPLGLVGVSLGTLIAVVTVDVVVAGLTAARAFGVPLATLWAGGLLRGLLPVVPAAVLAAALKQWAVAPTIPSVLINAAVVDLVFLVAFFFLGLETERRAAVWARVRRALRRSRPEAPPVATLAGLGRAS
jgi:O-antigen/teichoic acid export membrane protein